MCVSKNIKEIPKLGIFDKWIISLENEPEKHFNTIPQFEA